MSKKPTTEKEVKKILSEIREIETGKELRWDIIKTDTEIEARADISFISTPLIEQLNSIHHEKKATIVNVVNESRKMRIKIAWFFFSYYKI